MEAPAFDFTIILSMNFLEAQDKNINMHKVSSSSSSFKGAESLKRMLL